MPKVKTKSGKVKHLPYDKAGMKAAKKMREKDMPMKKMKKKMR